MKEAYDWPINNGWPRSSSLQTNFYKFSPDLHYGGMLLIEPFSY